MDSSSVWLMIAAMADFTGVLVHGLIGHRVMMSPLTEESLFPTRDFGDRDMSWRIFAVTWHVVTAAFACCGIALLLLAMGVLQRGSLPLVISAMHASFVVVALTVLGGRVLPAFRRPIPITFGVCMTTVCLASWLSWLGA